MSRASPHWLLGVVLLAGLVPSMAFACETGPQSAWTVRSANGRASLAMKGTTLTLRNARGKVLWKQEVPYLYQREAFISPSGRYVAAVKESGSAVLYGPKGKRLGTWSLLDSLTPGEEKRLPESSCGRVVVGSAAFKGEVLELKAGTALLRLDPQAGKLTRQLPRNAPPLPKLIERWRSSPAGSERNEALEALLVRALVANKPGALPELRGLWQELLTAAGAQPEERAAAVRGLGAIGTDEEVRALAAYLGSPLGPLVLATFEARLPPAAAFALVLPLCKDPEPAVRQRAVGHLLNLLEGPGPERKAALAALRSADSSSKLEPFPEGWIILGGLADLEGKHSRAIQLYTRGVTGLSSSGSPETRSAGSLELLFEALLQLAFEEKKQGRQDALSQRVHDVLSLPDAEETRVSAPKPNRYARAEGAGGKGQSAMEVARELIGRTETGQKRSSSKSKSKSGYDPFRVEP